jgi:hypothetical protein
MKKIFIICSRNLYEKVLEIKETLEKKHYQVFLPNAFDDSNIINKVKNMTKEEFKEFKKKMYDLSEETIKKVDALLVLNFDKEKNGMILKNYIGGSTFLEMFVGYRMGKKIYLYNDIPDGILYDEIVSFNVKIINGNLNLIEK